ncbi:two-component sensor histidine kinase [Streptacidiphilus pinicola]|uniref:histidine kinase n=1 Tax=Streptacidiphilus pinicola TaxID=2219663 RepID=A0A2X0IS57_9ACTN|nr:two-component sensor histidine kinase [Streptacidiphilus pinicola]
MTRRSTDSAPTGRPGRSGRSGGRGGHGVEDGDGNVTTPGAEARSAHPRASWLARRLRLTSLRIRMIAVCAVVALAAAVSSSGIAYWLNRDAVLKRTQDTALADFRNQLDRTITALPLEPSCQDLQLAANVVATTGLRYGVSMTSPTCTVTSQGSRYTAATVPAVLKQQVEQPCAHCTTAPGQYHLFWQRVNLDGVPYLIGGTRVLPNGPTAYMFKSLDDEQRDLNSLAWSLGIATLLALVGAALLAQAAAATVLRPVARLAEAARRLGEGNLDTRLEVTGQDELAELSRTFNHTAAALEAQVDELSAREHASRRFVADMSHELRTPLTAMTAVTDILEDEADALDPMIEPAVRLVVSETRRLTELVENLMEVTRFDAGTAKVVVDEVDIADLITSTIDARAWLDAVELDAPRGLVARVDPRRIDVVLANLIGNALKHGGSPVRVRAREESDGDGDWLVVEVADGGPGIPEDVLPHVFDRFFKADASRRRSEGSGLGLSIAMENARIHGGTITAANSADGVGAVFTLRLPNNPPTTNGSE